MALSKNAMLRLLVGSGLYLVTEDAVDPELRLRAVGEALAAGARVVQLRDKRTPKRWLLEEARSMKALCDRWGAAFIVNDDVALAWAADADGVHLGQDDLPVVEARRLLGEDRLIGLSVSALEEAREADRLGVDYIGVGAIHATPTKTDAELGGLELLSKVRQSVARPLVAIGGIDAGNAGTVFQTGADSVAVVRAVFGRPDVAVATRELLEIARRARAGRERD
ncbi:MAG: thiamine phosphate synthase [Chloroflexota bacterium]